MADKSKAKAKSKKNKKEEDIEAMLEDDEDDEDEDEDEDDDDLEEDDDDDEDEDEDEEDDDEDDDDEDEDDDDEDEDEDEDDEEEDDDDEEETVTRESVASMKKPALLELVKEAKLKPKRSKGVKLADMKVGDLRKAVTAAIPWDEEDEEDEDDEEEEEKPKRSRKSGATVGYGTNPSYKNKKNLITDISDAPVAANSKRWAGVKALMEEPRTLAEHQERAGKRHKAWKINGDAKYTNVIDANLIRDLRSRLGAVIEHEEEDNTFHIIGFVKGFYTRTTNGGASEEPVAKKKKKKAKNKK